MKIPRSGARRGRPPDPGKRRAILRAATRLFLSRGFAGTSMDAVAREAGVSKLTVYGHYQDKESLFQAMVRARCDAYNRPEDLERYLALEPRDALRRMGRNFLSLLVSPQVLQLHRVMVGEAARRPKMAELFFAAGPERTSALFAEYFRRATGLGRLRVDDPEIAAEHFQTLVKGMLHFRATLGLRPRPTRAQADRQVARAVDAFLRAYGPPRRA